MQYVVINVLADGSEQVAGGPYESEEQAQADASVLQAGLVRAVVPVSEVEAEPRDDGVLVRYDGGNRFISREEVEKMCGSDDPVTVR